MAAALPTTLNVVACSNAPYVFYDPNLVGNNRFSGFMPDMLQSMFVQAGYNISLLNIVYHLCSSNSDGVVAPNGTWDGVIGSMVSNEFDIAVYPMVYAEDRAEVVDFTVAVYYSGIAILTEQKSKAAAPFTFLKPFTLNLWLSIVATMFLIMALDTTFVWLTPFAVTAMKRVKRVDPPAPMVSYMVESSDDNYLFDSLLALFSSNWGAFRSSSWGMRIVFLYLAFFGMIIVTSYTANLTSFLTVSQLGTSIASLPDITQVGEPFAVEEGKRTNTYFRTSIDPFVQQAVPLLYPISTLNETLTALRNGSVVAFLGEEPVLKHYSYQLPCDLAVVGRPFAKQEVCFILTKDNPLTPVLSTALNDLRESGAYDVTRRSWFDDQNQCSGAGPAILNQQLQVANMRGLWYILLVVIGLALVILVLEHVSIKLIATSTTFKRAVRWWERKKQENREEKRPNLIDSSPEESGKNNGGEVPGDVSGNKSADSAEQVQGTNDPGEAKLAFDEIDDDTMAMG